jgi:hypothetical protein
MLRVHYDWLQAGEVVQRTIARLSEQLRRYLDDKAWLDNRRIMQLIREIEHCALAVRDLPPPGSFIELDAPAPDIELTMERPLFSPPLKPEITARKHRQGSIACEDLPTGQFSPIITERISRR